MFSYIVGNVDSNAAWVLMVLFIAMGGVSVAAIVNFRTKQSISNDFELAKIKQADETKLNVARIASDKDYKMGQLQQNLITSHKEVG